MAAQKAAILVENESNIAEINYYVAPKASFIKDKSKVSNTEKGTLYHLVIEHLPYDRLNENFDFDEFISGMCSSGYMSREEVAIIDKKKFLQFINSNLCKRMCKAQSNGKLRREQPFIIGLPATEIYEELNSAYPEIILMQGIIDAFFEEDNQIVLVDYKTDFVKRGHSDELVQKYSQQLIYYTMALENITGKKVKEKIIYSFALGKEVYIP